MFGIDLATSTSPIDAGASGLPIRTLTIHPCLSHPRHLICTLLSDGIDASQVDDADHRDDLQTLFLIQSGDRPSSKADQVDQSDSAARKPCDPRMIHRKRSNEKE